MSIDLPPDSTTRPHPGAQDALAAQMLSDELLTHWRDPVSTRLRPIALAAASDLLRRYAGMPLLDPALLQSIERSKRQSRRPARMFDQLEREVDTLRRDYHGANLRTSALGVAATAYRIATEGDEGSNIGNASGSSQAFSAVPSRRQLASLDALLEAVQTPAELHSAWRERPEQMRECIHELRQMVAAARLHHAGITMDQHQAA